jgi:hypothetical protein
MEISVIIARNIRYLKKATGSGETWNEKVNVG